MSVHDDASAQRDLVATLERFQGDARAALGLRATDDAAAARRVFMSLCKVYHPAKFARFGPATVKLSNEVFLAIRRAYETVAAQAAVPVPIGPSASGPVPRPAGSSPPPVGRSTPPAAGTTPPRSRATPPAGVPVTPRSPTMTPRSTPPTGIPRVPAPASPSGTATTARVAPRAPTVRPGGAPPVAPAAPSRDAAATQLERGLDLARQQRWTEARGVFASLATQHPGDTRYRAYLHYARGWEAYTLGKDGEARAEWQRSVACDPGNELARWALEQTGMVK